ncbi:MAG: hypothetical protein JWM27_3516 [Gemmatimonadetes bacterium]|nr:hypothetical protein [Gemmatimonadota bacterium]
MAPMPNPENPRSGALLDAAARIGARVASQALWEGDACTWQVMSPDRDNQAARVAVPARAGGTVYEGTAGIALFLAQLAAATGDREAARAAAGALRFSLAEADGLPPGSNGFHSGRVGIAYAALRAAKLLGMEEMRDAARRTLAPLEGAEAQDRGLDVIAGAAGAIPALLAMADELDGAWMLERAQRMGDNLLATAVREPDGWSWATMPQSSARNLNGLAHGAAGFGHALLELYDATGEGHWLHGAEQAFVYERRTFSAEHDNWPDLRHSDLSEYLHAGRIDELRRRIASPEGFPAYEPRHMSAWCHGAPGIGLTRLRAWELLGEPLYRDEAEAALRATLASIVDDRMNYSLCHGRAGNCETLLYGARVLGDDTLRTTAEDCMLTGVERWERPGVSWPCGTLGGVSDPGLLLGESGIGWFLLRLALPEVPSVLLVTRDGAHPDRAAAEPGRREARGADVDGYLGRTLRTFTAVGADGAAVRAAAAADGNRERSPVAAAVDGVKARISAEGGGDRAALLEDAARLDLARVELWRAVEDNTAEFIASLVRAEEDEVAWDEAAFALSPRARLVHSLRDWDGWLEDAAGEPLPPEDDVFVLLQSIGGKVVERRLTPFAAVVLEATRGSALLDDVVDRVAEAVSGDRAPDRDWLRGRVLEQLRQAYRAGFVESEPAGAGVPG